MTAAEALILLAASSAYLRLRLRWWTAVPVGQPGT